MTLSIDRSGLPQFTGSVEAGEILYTTGRTQVLRGRLAGTSVDVVCKRSRGPGGIRRLRHEAAMLSRLAGVEGVPQLLADPEAIGALVVADVGGVSLADVLRTGPLPALQLVECAERLAAVLDGVHRGGVAHRDINPANMLRDGSGALWLIDFDLATTVAEERPGFGHQTEIIGTLPYLAPEQTGRTGWPVDQRADLYGLGATLYELATGQPPFGRGELMQLVHDHLTRIPVSPVERNPEVPEGLARIVLRLLEKEPDRRYSSAEGLAHDLRRLRDELQDGADGLFPLGTRDFPLRLRPPTRLIGRTAEVEQLRAALTGAINGQCRGLLVTGPPGVGKTALIDELRTAVTAAGGWFVGGKFDQYRSDTDSDAVRQALRALGRLVLAEPHQELVAHRTRLREALGGNAGLIGAMLPEFAAILEVPPTQVHTDARAQDEARLIRAGLDLLRTFVTPARPLVMVLDDLQWAASTPITFVDALLLEANLPGLLLVGAYRDTEVDPLHPLAAKLARWERLEVAPPVLRLRNLPPTDLATLLAEMLRLPLEPATALADAVGKRTGGNPFDTVELVNAARADGSLVAAPEGWRWEAAAIHRYVGAHDVLELLAGRISRLPEHSRALLEIMACAGGRFDLDLLPIATGWSAARVEAALTPALEDGLLVVERDGEVTVRFRHDRVQQAAFQRLEPVARRRLHAELARRLAARPELAVMTAEQYLAAGDAVVDPGERRRAADLLRAGAGMSRLINPGLAEQLLVGARTLLEPVRRAGDDPVLLAIDIERHAVLCSLGRLDEADTVYQTIEAAQPPPLELARAACTQIHSLGNRNQHGEAVALGLTMLTRMGLAVPDEKQLPGVVEAGLTALQQWAAEDGLEADLARPPVTDPAAGATAELLNRLVPAAYFARHPVLGWLVCQAQRLWAERGPAAPLAQPLAQTGFVTAPLRGDYRTGYLAARRALDVSQARGYEPHTSQARFLFALASGFWFEPLEEIVSHAVSAREGLSRRGDLHNACWTYYVSLPALLGCTADLSTLSTEAEAAVLSAHRMGNHHAQAAYLAYRQFTRSLQGETTAPGSFTDDSVDETEYFEALSGNPIAAGHAHATRGLAAALFGDATALAEHAAGVLARLPFNGSTYSVAMGHFLQALSLAHRAAAVEGDERAALLAEGRPHLDWLAARAADSASNFAAMVKLIEAERACVAGDGWAAVRGFEAALHDAGAACRPWLRAYTAERAAYCHLRYGLTSTGQALLADARACYAEWGATAKVAEMDRLHPFLRQTGSGLSDSVSSGSATVLSSDVIDLLGLLEAARALSSETNLSRLRERVIEVLRAMTGATNIQVALWNDSTADWMVHPPDNPDGAVVGLEQAAAAGWLALSVFRYAERTRVPLVIDDATDDDRFAADEYVAARDGCSLLLVPVLSHGEPRAMLILENQLTRAAFTAGRLDGVLIIAGQLAVCLDNALLTASLEQKVAERTQELAAATEALERLSVTDPLTGLPNRRRLQEVLAAEWRRAGREGTPIGLVMVDIDNFKWYNDHYGHVSGDRCLSLIARTMAGSVRAYDLVARYGGEEFCVVLPGADAIGARTAAERLRSAVLALHEPHVKSGTGAVTISVGVATLIPSVDGSEEELVRAADEALYEAKRGGRNRVVLADSSPR